MTFQMNSTAHTVQPRIPKKDKREASSFTKDCMLLCLLAIGIDIAFKSIQIHQMPNARLKYPVFI